VVQHPLGAGFDYIQHQSSGEAGEAMKLAPGGDLVVEYLEFAGRHWIGSSAATPAREWVGCGRTSD
jgi:hypothetical protein